LQFITENSRPTLVIVEAQKNSTDTTVNVTWSLRHPVDKYCTVYYCQYFTECTVSCYHVKGGFTEY